MAGQCASAAQEARDAPPSEHAVGFAVQVRLKEMKLHHCIGLGRGEPIGWHPLAAAIGPEAGEEV